jgi:enediyne biosynthesis protein E4
VRSGSRGRRGLVAGLVVVAIVAVAGIGLAVNRFGEVTPKVAADPPRFVEESAAAGLEHVYDGGTTFLVGGGLAVFDCDDDGKPDMYLAGGSNPARLYRNQSPVGGVLRFAAVPDEATDLTGVNGAYPIDIDGDAQVDLAILRVGENVLLRGRGGCRFERANEAWSFDGGADWTTAFSATWEGEARLPTLAIGRYRALQADGEATLDCASNALFRPDPAGPGFAPPVPLAPGYCALSMLFSDWDRSGRRDLRASNDRNYYGTDGEEQLWRFAPGEAPRLYTADDGWVRVQVEGMGIASYDLTNDGFPEVYLTSQGDNKLQTLTAGRDRPAYRDIGLRRGVNVAQPFTGGEALPSTAWHPEFDDVNNDGFIDLFVSKGNVSAQPGYALRDPSNLLLGRADGTFGEAADTAGILSFARGRGAALTDFNLDGLLDLVELNLGDPVKLWRNTGIGAAEPGHWLAVQLRQSGPNRDSIGAWLEVRVGGTVMRREIVVGGGHSGGELGWTHVGLGPARGADVRAQWPDGETGPWQHVDADQFVIIERGAPQPRRWLPQD